jgi:glycosyltransferase involved in cell wall biosynthesis
MEDLDKKLVSICVPVFNEESVIPELFSRLRVVLGSLKSEYDFEVVFTDNHSTDSTWDLLKVEAASSLNFFSVKALRFSRNFGFQNSILENYRLARGDAVIQLDADLQDPPELISVFLQKWESGFDVVYGVRQSRSEGLISSRLRTQGYRILDFLAEHSLPENAGDFRLVDRKVLDALINQNLVDPYLRGSIASLGFNQIGIPFERMARAGGESKFPPTKVFALGLKGVINHSLIPLRLSTYLGAIVLFVSACGGVFYFIQRQVSSDIPPGFTTTQILILSAIGFNAFFLGIIGEYVSRIYRIVRAEPNAVIQDKI